MQNKQSTYAPVIASVKTSLKTHPGAVLLLVALIVASVVTSLLPPLVLKRVINELTAGKGISFRLSAGYLLLVIVSDLFETAQNSAITIFGQKITHGIRSVLCAKLDRLPADYFTKHPAGQITSVFVNDADTIDTLYSDGIVGMLADSFKLIGILGIIFTECPGLAILLVILTPFLAFSAGNPGGPAGQPAGHRPGQQPRTGNHPEHPHDPRAGEGKVHGIPLRRLHQRQL